MSDHEKKIMDLVVLKGLTENKCLKTSYTTPVNRVHEKQIADKMQTP